MWKDVIEYGSWQKKSLNFLTRFYGIFYDYYNPKFKVGKFLTDILRERLISDYLESKF